jgi:hypothetical protein
MSTRNEMRARLRVELGDTGSVQVWGDSLLDDLLVAAAEWYSRLFPSRGTAYREVTAGQRTFTLPEGALGIIQVECPPGRVLPEEPASTAGSTGGTGKRQGWHVWGDTIYLTNPAGSHEAGDAMLVLRLLLPWDRPDPAVDWNGPEDDERLLLLWATAEAYGWLDGQDQKRGRPAHGGAVAARYAEQLEREIRARRRSASSRPLTAG